MGDCSIAKRTTVGIIGSAESSRRKHWRGCSSKSMRRVCVGGGIMEEEEERRQKKKNEIQKIILERLTTSRRKSGGKRRRKREKTAIRMSGNLCFTSTR